jgi:hypothetical protein
MRTRIYTPAAVLALLIAFVGFWASYYGRIFTGTVTTPPIIQLHAAVFIGWLLLVIAQAALAARGRMALHMKVGGYGMAYGLLVVVIGVVATLAAFRTNLANANVGEARAILFVGLTDMLSFAPFLAAAWFYRRRPEIHKRLIVVATCVLLVAPAHRMHWFLGGPPAPAFAVLLIWLAPIYAAMLHDYIARRIVHPVYLLGICVILFMKFGRFPLLRSESWQTFVDWIAAFY